MNKPSNSPQHEQMADESMVRCLTAQARAIWPQESPLFGQDESVEPICIADIGCGTGEITRRLAERYPAATITGVDLVDSHLSLAAEQMTQFGPRVEFICADVYDLQWPDERFDLIVCRHLLQAVPDPKGLLSRFQRWLKPGGRVHLLAEDYGLMQFHPTTSDLDAFWRDGPWKYAASVNTDLRSGRKVGSWLSELGFQGITVDYLTIDSLRVERDVLLDIFKAWRDGFSQAIIDNSELSAEVVNAAWDDIERCLDIEHGYAVWHVPVWRARR